MIRPYPPSAPPDVTSIRSMPKRTLSNPTPAEGVAASAGSKATGGCRFSKRASKGQVNGAHGSAHPEPLDCLNVEPGQA